MIIKKLAEATGVELASIAAEINNIGARTKVANYHLNAFSLQGDDVREVRRTLYLLFAAVAFILLIGCANVANLLMIRARQRIHETTIRAALGASTFRLIQQILTETLVTVLLGGAVALLLGWAALKAIAAVEPSSFANLGHVSLDLRVLAFTFTIVVWISAIVALAPIFTVRHLKLAEDLKRSGRSTTRKQSKSTTVLVATEVALAFVLLIGTGLLVRTFANILRVDPGFRAENVFTPSERAELRCSARSAARAHHFPECSPFRPSPIFRWMTRATGMTTTGRMVLP